MDLNKNLTTFIRSEASKYGWRTNADYARHIGFTAASWSRIMRRLQPTIKDSTVKALCEVFNLTQIDLLLIVEGTHKQHRPPLQAPCANCTNIHVDLTQLSAPAKTRLLDLCANENKSPVQMLQKLIAQYSAHGHETQTNSNQTATSTQK